MLDITQTSPNNLVCFHGFRETGFIQIVQRDSENIEKRVEWKVSLSNANNH